MLSLTGTPTKIEVVGDLKDVANTPQAVTAVQAALATPPAPAPAPQVKDGDKEK